MRDFEGEFIAAYRAAIAAAKALPESYREHGLPTFVYLYNAGDASGDRWQIAVEEHEVPESLHPMTTGVLTVWETGEVGIATGRLLTMTKTKEHHG